MLTAIIILIVFLLTVYTLITSIFTRKKLHHFKRNGITVNRTPSVWLRLLLFMLPKNQNFNFHVRMFQFACGLNRAFDKERILAVFVSQTAVVHIYKPEHIEAILSNNNVLDKAWMYQMLHPWLGTGLLTSSRDKWRTRRKLLTPAFHFKILEKFQPIFNAHSFVLINKLMQKTNDPYINIVPVMSLCTLDIIGETAMGVKINSQENEDSDYVKAVGKMETLITRRIVFPWLWSDFIFYLTPGGKEFRKMLNIIHGFARKVIAERKQEILKEMKESKNIFETDSQNIYLQEKIRRPFLDLLLYHHLNDERITEEDIREEVDTFMFEGHDTTSLGISWTLYNLGLYPDIQEKAYEEIYKVFGEDKEREVTIEDLREMKYLECCIKESLRLYPSVPFIIRCHPEDIEIDNITIPKNALLGIFIYSIHRDPEIYPDPEIYKPERFSPENSIGRHPFAYIPFSAGPRNCIGQKFAMLEEKTVVANLLRHFRFRSIDLPDKVTELGELVLRPLNGLRIKFERR